MRIHPFTRRDAAAEFFGEENVPYEAITMGCATILSAREIIVVALGENKAGIVQRAVEGPETVDLPASLLHRHPNVILHLDRDSSAELMRVKTPWRIEDNYVFSGSDGKDREILRAVIWLAQQTNKPIQRLSQDDYIEGGLSSLTLSHDTDAINRSCCRELANKVRDHESLPAKERVILFSPHPDDDVISAGGIFRKLVDNANDVSAAYQTSGNIAVFDHDVLRYIDFVEKYLHAHGFNAAEHGKLRDRVEQFLAQKRNPATPTSRKSATSSASSANRKPSAAPRTSA